MPLRRSDTMRAVDAVQPLVEQFNALDDGDKLTFLDLVDPLPDKATHSHKQKKSSKKSAGGGGRGKSKHASSLQQQIQGTATGKPHLGEGPVCGICAHTEDYEDHFKPSPHHHQFQPPATTAASGGGG